MPNAADSKVYLLNGFRRKEKPLITTFRVGVTEVADDRLLHGNEAAQGIVGRVVKRVSGWVKGSSQAMHRNAHTKVK